MPLQVFKEDAHSGPVEAVYAIGTSLRGFRRTEVDMSGFAIADNRNEATALGTCTTIGVRLDYPRFPFGLPVAAIRLAIAAFLAIVATLSMPCAAAEFGPSPHGWIVQAGDPADCPDMPLRVVPGPWFGLRKQGAHWWLTATNVSIDKGNYRSSGLAQYLIELDKPLVDGMVADAAIVRKGSEYAFNFKGTSYRWVQMSGKHYVLTDGRTIWSNDHFYYRMTGRPGKPSTGSSTAPRCGYEGCHELRWAGDLNRDGQLDLLVWFGEGEDEGWVLWFGRQTRHGLVFEAAARSLFDYNAGFSCAFRKMQEGRHDRLSSGNRDGGS